MSQRGGGRRGGRGGRGGAGFQPGRAAPPPPMSSQSAGQGGRGRGAPPQQRTRVEDPGASSSSASTEKVVRLSREVEERLHVGGSYARDPTEMASPALLSVPSASISTPAASSSTSVPPASTKALVHPHRPGFGTVGRQCVVRANHFLVRVQEKDLFQYEVKIEPELTSRARGRLVMKNLIAQYGASHLGNRTPAYDGRNIVYTAGALPFDSKDFEIILIDEKGGRERKYRVSIKFAKAFDIFPLKEFLTGKYRDCPQDTIQALDVVLREYPSENYVTVSRSFFSPSFGSDTIGDGLECWRGYYQSLRPTQMGLSLNLDLSATSFYSPVAILDFIAEHLNLEHIPSSLLENQRVKIQKALRGVRVIATHRPDMPRRYRIVGITSQSATELRFTVDEQGGAAISVAQYFHERYNYRLKFVADTFILIPFSEFFGKQLLKQNNYSNDKHVKEFGIVVDSRITSVDARVLPPPRLKYHDSGNEKTCNPSVGQWNMINKKMVDGGHVDAWACICFARLHREAVYTFCEDLVNMCNNIGMVFNYNPVVGISFRQPSQIDNGLRELLHQSVENLRRHNVEKQLQLLIIVLPDASGSYGRIKRLCETELGIVTQCCKPKNVLKSNKQYLENVALKINVKVGGRNTVLEDALNRRIPLVSDAPTIIFGADVTHPSPGEDSQSSIAAVVASMDWPWITKYRGLVSAQQHRQEIIEGLFTLTQDPQKGNVAGGMVRELLVAFYKATNQKPHRIIFYRDGVSEGQFSQVLLYEMDAIRKACSSLQEGYLPPVTFVVVQKRHHTRLFPADHNQRNLTDKSGNILPGTVVDKVICHPTEFDFYLCSHAGIQGTSRPTHYHVLLDENRFTADTLQTLTNNLCYT
ncbi:Protein argonaute MEL1 [Apostasia shenzhenica]|uniref:Protein argonaute MEL1 n=1 Tax=Apostasia shenzhenica TaxID=1088818 RepID=A0A2I0A6E4_9ASPA|nr:Protein argonaute MEL1 [Apostasia shenzhenica]